MIRLALTLPPGWVVAEHDGYRVASAPDGAADLLYGGLVARPDADEAWWREAPGPEGPAGAEVVIDEVERTANATGFGLTLVRGRAAGAARLAAFYDFMEYGAVVVVRGASSADVRAALASGRPMFSDEIVALEDCFG